MSTHILTLFGEEIVPEQLDAVGKKKSAPKKKKEPKQKSEPEQEEVEEPTPVAEDPLKDWTGEKKYYTIGEVAKLFNVRTSNIRYWTKEFGLRVRTTRKGDRLFTPENIKEIRTIYHLVKHRGFTINGAKTKLKESKKLSVESIELKDSLLQLRNKLVELKNSIK